MSLALQEKRNGDKGNDFYIKIMNIYIFLYLDVRTLFMFFFFIFYLNTNQSQYYILKRILLKKKRKATIGMWVQLGSDTAPLTTHCQSKWTSVDSDQICINLKIS